MRRLRSVGSVGFLSLVLLAGCYNKVDLPQTVAWEADDKRPIAEPEAETEGQWLIWDGTDKMLFHPGRQFFNLGRSLRAVGTWVGAADPIEAGNVNTLDEAPNSTWFTNRHFLSRLSQAELAGGALRGEPPSGPWTVTGGKESAGSTPGFVVRDSRGETYLLKFDPPSNPEMTTAAETITPRFLHAAGYNVSENYLLSVDPDDFDIDPEARIRGKYRVLRPMTRADIDAIFERIPHRPDGTIRAVASKFLPGVPKGPFLYEGRRPDDINDRIRHENRRELRGLRVLAAFLNHTDTKAANALDMYDPQSGFLTHYLIDFSATLGADNANPQFVRYGNEYYLDFGAIGRSTAALGAYVKPWEIPLNMPHPAVGYFEAARFDPERWRPTFPNPAFKRMTLRDAYWGAKLVTSFTDEDIDTIVRTGEYTDPRAERYVAAVLKARRDKIGRYYFNRVNPLDRFRLEPTQSDGQALTFENLALAGGYAPTAQASYRYSIAAVDASRAAAGKAVTQTPQILLDSAMLESVSAKPHVVTIETSYDDGRKWSKRISVYLRYQPATQQFAIVGIYRET